MFTVSADYANLSWILHVEDVDADGCAWGTVTLDGDETQIADVTSADIDNVLRMHNDNEQLFIDILNANFEAYNNALAKYEAGERAYYQQEW